MLAVMPGGISDDLDIDRGAWYIGPVNGTAIFYAAGDNAGSGTFVSSEGWLYTFRYVDSRSGSFASGPLRAVVSRENASPLILDDCMVYQNDSDGVVILRVNPDHVIDLLADALVRD